MTSEIMDVARNNQIFKIFLHGVPRRNFRFDLRKKTVLLLAEICAHSKASNAQVQGRPLGVAEARSGGGVPCNAQLGAAALPDKGCAMPPSPYVPSTCATTTW